VRVFLTCMHYSNDVHVYSENRTVQAVNSAHPEGSRLVLCLEWEGYGSYFCLPSLALSFSLPPLTTLPASLLLP